MTLRLLGAQDIDFMLKVENDPEVWSFSSLCDAPYTRAEIAEFCNNSENRVSVENLTQLRYVIVCNNQSLGFIDLYDIQGSRAKVAIIIYPKELRGGGIGQCALELLRNEICVELGIKNLTAEVDPSNIGAINFFRKIGITSQTLIQSSSLENF